MCLPNCLKHMAEWKQAFAYTVMVIHFKLCLAEQISNMDFNKLKLWRWERTDHWKGRKTLSKSPNTVTQLNDFLSAAFYLTSLIFVHTCLGWFRIRGCLCFFLAKRDQNRFRQQQFITTVSNFSGVCFCWLIWVDFFWMPFYKVFGGFGDPVVNLTQTTVPGRCPILYIYRDKW